MLVGASAPPTYPDQPEVDPGSRYWATAGFARYSISINRPFNSYVVVAYRGGSINHSVGQPLCWPFQGSSFSPNNMWTRGTPPFSPITGKEEGSGQNAASGFLSGLSNLSSESVYGKSCVSSHNVLIVLHSNN